MDSYLLNKFKNKQNCSSNGFTLLELLVSVVIISILAAISVPSWLAFVDTQRLNTAQNEVYLAIRQAQSQAIKNKLTWQVSFREQNDIVQWAVYPPKNPANTIWNNLDSNVRLDAETTSDKSNGVKQIQFDERGHFIPPFRRITLSSKSGGKAKRCVYISTILGAMRTAKENDKPDKDGKYCY
ncbi:prepilin-type cleavage/methylation domain-containing protein [Brasilonema octagenarum UFV-E1]|uniref:Prepilin-type cleavage/methylation domain-containing protein n=2 Tax=Brasilonema TaxID=383614 RepID=A0A856MP56_9CYAN|nr:MULTISPECIES: GspH/FimT family pseudopilin [Brasilonema]NMF66785.1 prepilin-type cleavage/methylation domain-containing protein [Brasilonema octagenarum UFV-OR1]QDL11880.1 prepilin-type cleavage/methylation domain-containing protein [Brasilonema sennae CENA114]QDL18254.1 prepilin-type cleavage/methylation domain-containing protein [Brasilonema octagenarum UFV-E1]